MNSPDERPTIPLVGEDERPTLPAVPIHWFNPANGEGRILRVGKTWVFRGTAVQAPVELENSDVYALCEFLESSGWKPQVKP